MHEVTVIHCQTQVFDPSQNVVVGHQVSIRNFSAFLYNKLEAQ